MDDDMYPIFDRIEVASGGWEGLGAPQGAIEDARERLKLFRDQGRRSRHRLCVVRVDYTQEKS